MRTALPLAVLLLGCKHGDAPDPTIEHRGSAPETGTRVTSATEIHIAFAGEQPAHPPIVTVLLDVTLHNPDAAPRWYLVPARFGAGADLHGGSVHSIAVRAGGGVKIGQFTGRAGFHAVLVPAGATVAIAHLPVELWYEVPPPELSFDVASTAALAIGPDPAEQWFGKTAASAAARVEYDSLEMVSSRSSPELHELPVVLTGERRLPVTVRLDGP